MRLKNFLDITGVDHLISFFHVPVIWPWNSRVNCSSRHPTDQRGCILCTNHRKKSHEVFKQDVERFEDTMLWSKDEY